ncbi:MAG: tRNA lysidine(34) synthetase TilS, partial [Gemmatimonadales bacterium]
DYHSSLGTALLVTAFRRAGAVMGTDRAADVLRFAGKSASGQRMDLGRGWWAERAFDRLHFVCDARKPEPGPPFELTPPRGALEWGGWKLVWRRETAPSRMGREDMTTWLTPVPLSIREWSEGDRVRPLGGTGHRLVVRCFQDARVPRRQRRAWPVFQAGSEIVWVPGVVRADGLVPPAGEEALRIDASFG